MQTVYALPGIARRWSGLTTLIALATTVTLVRLTTLAPAGLSMSGARIVPTSFYMLHPHLGWDYFGYLMNGHGAPPPPRPQPDNGGRNLAAGLGAALEDRRQDDPALAGTELASGRRAKDDAEAKGGKGKADTLDSVSALAAASETARGQAAAQPDLIQLGLPAKYAATYFHDTTPARPVVRPAVGPESILTLVSRTWVSSPQQFLAQILPGAKFFLVSVGVPPSKEFWLSFDDGQSFRLDELSGILTHEGISFDSSSVYAAAKLAVLFAYCGHGPTTEPESARSRHLDDVLDWRDFDSLAFPSIDFRSLERGRWRSTGGTDFDGVWVDCVIDGLVRRLFVTMRGKWSGKLQPSFEIGPDVKVHFGWNGGGGVRTGQHGALNVTCCHNVESDGSHYHYFARVEVDGSSVDDSIVFALSGFAQNETGVKLVFARAQDPHTAEDTVGIDGQGCATYVWHPTADSNGSYKVHASSHGGNDQTPDVYVDVESWVTASLDGGKTACVHYMERNDVFAGLLGKETADSVGASIRAAWDTLTDSAWLDGVYPVLGDTFHVAVSPQPESAVAWFHVPNDGTWSGCFAEGKSSYEHHYWIGILGDYDHWSTSQPKMNLLLSVAAHEMWHACQFKLRGETVLLPMPQGLSQGLAWITEGQARFVQSAVCGWELTKSQGVQYPGAANGHLAQHDWMEGLRYYPFGSYQFCLFWRHVYEHANAPEPTQPAIEVAKRVKNWTKLDSLPIYCASIIDTALLLSDSRYANFDSCLTDFNSYCCLTQRSSGGTPYWDSGGASGIYDSLSPDPTRRLLYGSSSKLWAATNSPLLYIHPHSSRIYSIVRDSSVQHKDNVFLVFDRRPSSGPPSSNFDARLVVFRGSDQEFHPFTIFDDTSRIALRDSGWDRMYVQVTYLNRALRGFVWVV